MSRSTISLVCLWIVTACVALPRMLGHKGEAYQAVAHVFVGYLIGRFWQAFCSEGEKKAGPYFLMAAILCAVELVAFIASR